MSIRITLFDGVEQLKIFHEYSQTDSSYKYSFKLPNYLKYYTINNSRIETHEVEKFDNYYLWVYEYEVFN